MKISNLPLASSLNTTDNIPLVQSGVTKKVAMQTIKDYTKVGRTARVVREYTLETDINSINVNVDNGGNTFKLKEMFVLVYPKFTQTGTFIFNFYMNNNGFFQMRENYAVDSTVTDYAFWLSSKRQFLLPISGDSATTCFQSAYPDKFLRGYVPTRTSPINGLLSSSGLRQDIAYVNSGSARYKGLISCNFSIQENCLFAAGTKIIVSGVDDDET